MQTHAGPVLATSVSDSPYSPCLVDSVGHILLVSFIPSDSYNLSSPSSVIFPKLQGNWNVGMKAPCRHLRDSLCSVSCVDAVLSSGAPLSDFGEQPSSLALAWVVQGSPQDSFGH